MAISTTTAPRWPFHDVVVEIRLLTGFIPHQSLAPKGNLKHAEEPWYRQHLIGFVDSHARVGCCDTSGHNRDRIVHSHSGSRYTRGTQKIVHAGRDLARARKCVCLSQRRHSETRALARDRKSTRLNSSHSQISYAVFCLKKK